MRQENGCAERLPVTSHFVSVSRADLPYGAGIPFAMQVDVGDATRCSDNSLNASPKENRDVLFQ